MRFSEKTLETAQSRLKELLGHVTTQSYLKRDLMSAAICALTLRQLFPDYEAFMPHDPQLHNELNRLFAMDPPDYLYQACDSLLHLVKDELARRGITDAEPPAAGTAT